MADDQPEIDHARFRDSEGREWRLELTQELVNRAHAVLGIDLTDVANGRLLLRLATDRVLLQKVLAELLADAAKNRGVNHFALAKGLTGEAVADGFAAYLAAVHVHGPTQVEEGVRMALNRLGDATTLVAQAANDALPMPKD